MSLNVALFATCINDTMKPSIPIATVKLLERLDIRSVRLAVESDT